MGIVMEGNHAREDRTMVHVPTSVDSSIPGILAHRGVPPARIAKLIADLDSRCTLATIELTDLLPCGDHPHSGAGYEHVFDVQLGRNGRWNGTRVILRMELPETMRAALVGRPLRDAVDHPALPDRPIVSIDQDGPNLVIHVEGDPRPVVEISRASDAVLAGSQARNLMRRRWITSQLDRPHSDTDWLMWTVARRGKAVENLMNGIRPVHGDRCWGEPAPFSMAGIAYVAGAWARVVAGWMGGMAGRADPDRRDGTASGNPERKRR
jgi:hypothetical protein